MRKLKTLSRREREIMDIVYGAGCVTAGEVRTRMPAAPSYSAVRATLSILEKKGVLRHELDGVRYVYVPVVGRERARQGAIEHLLDTFFDGSAAGAVLTLLERSGGEISRDQLDRMSRLIDRARKEGR